MNKKTKRRVIRVATWVVLCVLSLPLQAAETVKVGGYVFPPYVELDADNQPIGLTLELIDLLNASQSRYTFDFVLTSPNRRYRDFEARRFDMLLFESPEWGWQDRGLPYTASDVFMEDGEVYIARNAPGRDQAYFDRIAEHRIAAILGYHYGFADFVGDPQALQDAFDIILVNSNQASIELVLAGRADVAAVTRSYLNRYLNDHPEAAEKLLISERMDQVYRHRILVREGIAPHAGELNRLLDQLEEQGALRRLRENVGIER